MRQRNRHDRPDREGATLKRVRLNEAVTHIVFGGRRRRVYARIAALSGARPGDRVLDVGCTTSRGVRQDAFGQMYWVLRPGGTLPVADLRPSGRLHWLHARAGARRHGDVVPLEDLAAAAALRVEDRGDLPLLRYVRAVRPSGTSRPLLPHSAVC